MDSQLVFKYKFAKQVVCDEGYSNEIEWQNEIYFEDLEESNFLKELAWVILSAGMKEQVIRGVFYKLTPYFYDWQSAKLIVNNKLKCYENAIRIFRNHKKISAIIESAEILYERGFDTIKEDIKIDPLKILRTFPFIGNITVYHLAKNIGLSVAKPDRHLVRIAHKEGFDDVQDFCKVISELSGDSVPVVDIVFWRFANLTNDYLNILSSINFQN